MADRLVCDINFYFYTIFIFGIYHDFGPSHRTRWLAKAYCLLVCVILIFCMYLYTKINSYNNIILFFFVMTEYLSNILFSMIQKKKYLQQYYHKMKFIDDMSNTSKYKTLLKWLIINLILATIFTSLVQCSIYYIYWDFIVDFSIFLFSFEIWIYVILVCGRLPMVFVFSLMYCRVRFMKTTLERNQFNCVSQGSHHPRRYIQMYETIMDSFEQIEKPMKIQLSIFFILWMPTNVCLYMILLEMVKSNIIHTVFLLWMLVDFICVNLPIIIFAILSDLISDEVQEMLEIILEKRNQSSNEREYAEIQKLFTYIKSRPFNYTVWRVMPLNIRSILFVVSFCITTIIAVLQIKDYV